ncbi:hypothetical protein V1Y59_12355 [Gordonia sp. PKS22-38]|uniref:MmpS family membrane protein n=1 Tax=Gordonia prachuapensis TaxID=3115651 RepID=A0ABU7MUB3_9ACTN|nr:hypothetical protein [Gordonia sp. PKS22-38]
MGHPTGQPPDDLYRTPLYPQLYPPLGYAPDGSPIFVPGQPPDPGRSTDTTPPQTPDGSVAPDSDKETDDGLQRSPSDRRLVGIVALVAVAALGLLALTVGRAALRGDDPVTQPTLPMVISELPTPPRTPQQEPTAPGDPAVPGNPAQPGGREVVYEVAASSPATILYVDDVGLRTTIGSSTSWTITFTGSANPLRVLVLAGDGEATCSITVDGRVVATDRITAESPRRTVSCRA